ncbi:MAG TPA: CAP domain-containing protein [Solirubrobacteraceae bacterium]|nr:CAP domain-containing protein [Solirubrobacteraceae bacterium]
MLVPAARRTSCTRAALGAAIAALVAVPATAAAQDPLPLPTVPSVPSVPSISLPLSVSAAQPCPGARRRSGERARRVAVGCLVNKARTAAGLRGFAWSRSLGRAATRHARDMSRHRFFAHQRAGGPSLARRARAAGFRGSNVGEAIGYGCGSLSTPAAIVRMWLASPPHRAILLSRRGRVGIGVAGRPPRSCGGRGATYVLDAG